MKNNLKKHLNRISLKTQLAVLITVSFSAIIIFITAYIYRNNANAFIEQETDRIAALLSLESKSYDEYLGEIDRYSLLLRYETGFMQIIGNSRELSYEDQITVSTLLRSQFDSRKDLISYRLFLTKKDTNYQMDSDRHKVTTFSFHDYTSLPCYDEFTSGRYYKAYTGSTDDSVLMVYYRTIIRIEDQSPLAIVELTLDPSYIEALTKSNQDNNECFYLTDSRQNILYSSGNNSSSISTTFSKARNTVSELLAADASKDRLGHFTTDRYLVVYSHSGSYDYTFMTFKPIADIEQGLRKIRNQTIFLEISAIALTIMITLGFIKWTTRPLTDLTDKLMVVGTGNFKTTIKAQGSKEICELADEYNTMIFKIDELIKKTYISELNEKTARLIALEAQTNPHFLYNTLQAISYEAIVNRQPKINYMITSLASLLRYAVKSGDYTTLKDEILHVEKYLALQKARFDENLDFELDVDAKHMSATVPKISILTLVENAISHGMKESIFAIAINIKSTISQGHLIITVSDNGFGIEPESLEQLRAKLREPDMLRQHTGIGLINLASRLHILYNEESHLTVDSQLLKGTTVTMTIKL